MGMDLRFYERKDGLDRTEIKMKLIVHFRGLEVYHAIGDQIGYGLNGSYSPIYASDLDAVIKSLEAEDTVVGSFGCDYAIDVLRDVRRGIKDDDDNDRIYFEWDN